MFRDDLDELIQRIQYFHDSAGIGSALVEITSIAGLIASRTDLRSWQFPSGLARYLEAEYNRCRDYWQTRKEIRDDRIPSVMPWFGIAEHSAYVGGEVVFEDKTSYHKAFLEDWNDLEKLTLNEENPWRRMLDDSFRILKELSGDECAVSLRGTYSPMEVANSIRGNDFLMDFYLYPEETKTLMDFSTRAVRWNIERQMGIVDSFHGGYITGFKSWIPGYSYGHMSEDTSTLTGPEIYRQYGLPYTRKAVEGLDRLFMHTHGLGAVSLPVILELDNLYMIEISSDPNCPRAIDVFRDNEVLLADKTVVLQLTREEITNNMDLLKRNKTIIWYDAKSLDDASETITIVRRELPIWRSVQK